MGILKISINLFYKIFHYTFMKNRLQFFLYNICFAISKLILQNFSLYIYEKQTLVLFVQYKLRHLQQSLTSNYTYAILQNIYITHTHSYLFCPKKNHICNLYTLIIILTIPNKFNNSIMTRHCQSPCFLRHNNEVEATASPLPYFLTTLAYRKPPHHP